MITTINIKGIDKALLLATLYNNSHAQGMGVIHFTPEDMTKEEAQKLLDSGRNYFDYVKGRVMKVNVSGDELSTGLYNRDIGHNAAEEIIAKLRK